MMIFVRGFQSTFPGDDDSPGEEVAPLLIQNEIWATEEQQGGRSARGYPLPSPLAGSRRQQPVLLEKLILLHQPAEDPQQADQVETLEDDGKMEKYFSS